MTHAMSCPPLNLTIHENTEGFFLRAIVLGLDCSTNLLATSSALVRCQLGLIHAWICATL